MKKRGKIMDILIDGAWVYANGSLHIGHIAGLLSGDIIARYYRLAGEEVCYVSGSDCHGTPVTIRAKASGQSPEAISDQYHDEFVRCFNYLGFSYDYYGKTSSKGHKAFVMAFHQKLYESPHIYEKAEPTPYCDHCGRFLPDRLVVGVCPNCAGICRGDQCDHCGQISEAPDIIDIQCSDCGHVPRFITSKHLYLRITDFEKELTYLVNDSIGWRKNAICFTNRYINEGLRDRAITRDLDWGIDVPKDGYTDKKIYIWAENVLGYLSSSYLAVGCDQEVFQRIWSQDARHYYVHGKDNIPFHSIILPALLLASGEKYRLPSHIMY
jgi:methionyl-tRNA synthetase